MFECASALGTVGLSRGITPGLTSIGKGIIIVLMFVGRIGPVVLGMSLLARDEDEPEPPVNGHEDLTV
jgi:trk system potassium uptake protein TrkH